MITFVDEYRRIKENHLEAERHFYARINLSSSIVRVFEKDTKQYIYKVLLKLDIDSLGQINSQLMFKQYFEQQLELLSEAIYETNRNNKRIMPGYKWGHSTKILCLYIRDIVIHSRRFDEQTSTSLSYFLYTPLDSIIINRLRKLGYKVPFKSIKEIDCPCKFYAIQEDLNKAAVQTPSCGAYGVLSRTLVSRSFHASSRSPFATVFCLFGDVYHSARSRGPTCSGNRVSSS